MIVDGKTNKNNKYFVHDFDRNYKADVDESSCYNYFYNKTCPNFERKKIHQANEIIIIDVARNFPNFIALEKALDEKAKKLKKIDLFL